MTTNYSESCALSTKDYDRRFLFYVRWKGYKQKVFRCSHGRIGSEYANTLLTTKLTKSTKLGTF